MLFRLVYGAVGILFLGLVAWGFKTGRFPNRTEWVTRADRPIAFWFSMGVTLLIGGFITFNALFDWQLPFPLDGGRPGWGCG